MRALIIDAEELFRLSLREVISVSGPFTAIAEADSEASFLTTTAQERNIDLVIMYPTSISDDTSNYLTLTRRLYPNAAIISFSSSETIQHSMRHGDVVILPRSSGVEKIISTIRRALNLPPLSSAHPGAPNVRPMMQADPQRPATDTSAQMECLARLSGRQRQILLMTADGLANKEIAAQLSIAEGTVKAHMHAIFKVLGVTNRTQAVVRYGNLAQPKETSVSPDFARPYESRTYYERA